MTASPLKKFLLPAFLLSGSLFCALTVPLAFLGYKPIEIQLQEEPIFFGQLKDIASPYLGLTTVISLGAGVTSVAVTGWRHSSEKKNQTKQQLSDLQQELKATIAQLDELKMSELRLKAAGLDYFLEDSVEISHPVVEVSTPSGSRNQSAGLVVR